MASWKLPSRRTPNQPTNQPPLPSFPPRVVTLVLAHVDGEVLGSLDPFEVATPWWMDVVPLVRDAADLFGIAVTVVRLLSADQPAPHGGAVAYLATVGDESRLPTSIRPFDGDLSDDPLRAPYAHIGGPESDLAWARARLPMGMRVGVAEQHRTWNLSSIWRIPTDQSAVWLKHVPSFFSHEGRVITYLREQLGRVDVPEVIALDRCRLLLRDIPGTDRYEASLSERKSMIRQLVDIQQQSCSHVEALLALGAPDWRATALTASIQQLVDRRAGTLRPTTSRVLHEFAESLPTRFAAVEACGLVDTLIHGDFHPGNVRGDATRATILDWGDSGIGHPMLDQPAFLRTSAADDEVGALAAEWSAAWRQVRPGSDPDRAAELLGPVAAARQALIYQGFLDRIEVSERPYHAADVDDWLAKCASMLAG
jgi:Phosphotransferase enzyme family